MKKLIFIFTLLFSTSLFASEKLTVLLDWFLNPNHAPLYVAQHEGFFKAQGLDVTLIGPADPTDPPKLVAAGKADIAITYQPQFLQQINAGLPLLMIGTLIDKPLNCLVVLKNNGIESFKDLKGKRLGYSGTGMENVTLKLMLEHNGMKFSDVEAINIHYDLSQALLSKQIDGVTGMMRTFEVLQLELLGHPALIFKPEENGMPTYSELIFVAHEKNKQDSRMNKFLFAVKQGLSYLKAHPEEMWQAFSKEHPELNNELNHRAWFATIPYLTADPFAFNQTNFLKFAGFMQKNGLIKTVAPIEKYVAVK